MEAFPIALAAAGLFAAGVVKGATGLGYASCALPFLVAIVGLKPAMSLVLVPAMATNMFVALTAGHLHDTIRRLWPLYLAMLPGIALGLLLLLSVDQRIAVAGLGAVMILYSTLALTKPEFRIPARWQAPLQIPTGFANGVITGLTGSQVMPLIPYVMGLNLDPTRMVQAVNTAVIIASLVLGIGLAASGILTPTILGLSIAAIVPATIGAAIGSRLRALLPDTQFRKITLIVLAAMGVAMLVRA